MAYAQQPRYGAAQRPQFDHQQADYDSIQQPYAAEYGYIPAEQGAYPSGRNRHGPPENVSAGYAPNERDVAYGHHKTQAVNMGGYGDMRPYGGRGHDEGRRPPVQQSRQRPPDSGPLHSDSSYRGQPQFRPPERSRYEGTNAPYQAVGGQHNQEYQQEYQQQYQSEHDLHNGPGAAFRRGGGFGDMNRSQLNGPGDRRYDDVNRSQLKGWESEPNNIGPAGANQDYHQNPNGEYHEQGYADSHSRPHPENHTDVSPIPNSAYQEPPRSSHGHPPSISSKSQSSQRSKASSKRVTETTISPDTVAWDNPFPTFPMRPKKNPQASSRSLDDPLAEAGPRNEQRPGTSHEPRSQTASSNTSSYTIGQPHSLDENINNSQNHQNVSFNHQTHIPIDANRNAYQARPPTRENGSSTAYAGQLQPPIVSGRHSEDNRTRPSVTGDPAANFEYERSRTMPAAISEAGLKPSNRPRPPVQTNWQEPGPVASYYGPDDGGFTPTNLIDPSGKRPHGQPRGKSDEVRPYGHAAVQNPQKHAIQGQNQGQRQGARQHDVHQDSVGDVFDDYYDTPPPQVRQPYANPGGSQFPTNIDEDMPKFDDAQLDSTPSHRRGPIFEKHLERRQEYQPAPVPPQGDSRRDPRNNMYANGPVPRSRSQPNLKNRPSPRMHESDGFNFGIPGPSERPPATAPAGGDHDPSLHGSTRIPNPASGFIQRDQNLREQAYPRSVAAEAHFNGDRNLPPSKLGPPPGAYQVNGGPERYRSPPQNAGTYGPPAMAYQDNAQPDRYRSPPNQGSQPRFGPTRPSPNDRHMGNGPTTIPPQVNGRTPTPQDSRSREGQIMRPGGRPPAVNLTGPPPPPFTAPVNPDTLPSHPAPVRAGLMGGSPVNQNQKPPPVRQYNAVPTSIPLSEPSQQLGIASPPQSKRENVPVTHQELDRLRQATTKNPSDLATQLVLAKRLVEAASVLVDERGDPRTRSKSREKYIMDAHKIVKKLSSSGYTEATFYLADCYTRGALGLESDTREAFKLYQNAAKAGHAQAAYRVAVCCEIGQEEGGGTSRDAVKAMQWYKRAATLGDTPAMYKMGIISLKGLLGQPRNSKEAVTWLKKAAERADAENPHALHELALLHQKPTGNEGVPQDEAYSNRLFIQAANLGYKFSQYRLGSAYEYGLMGCPVDPRQSIAWYSKAAVQEEHQSELALSGWYLTGSEGILQQSDTEAYLWARKAALAGLAKAEYAMGYFTEVGIGATANLEDAKRWYWKAASQNFPKARDRLEELRKGGPTKRKERVSRSNIRKSSEGECTVM